MNKKMSIIFIVLLSIGILGCQVDPGSESEPTPTPIDESSPTPIDEPTTTPLTESTPSPIPTDAPTPIITLEPGIDTITVTFTNSSSLNPADSILIISWGPGNDPEGDFVVEEPTFPYVYEISSYTPDEIYGVVGILMDSDGYSAFGSDEWDTSGGGDYTRTITIEDPQY
ncbi:MAG: hypothetical protein JXJ04_02710 [Spirochaetales bacterium]|nr:hypothetical protein [Spirochaetales bacterium]